MTKVVAFFDGDVSKWNTAKVTKMNSMFNQAKVFNGDVSKWDTAQVEEMNAVFFQASKFNQDLSKWNTTRVVNGECTDFALDSNCPIDDTPTSKHEGEQTCKAKLENCAIDS